MLFMSAMAHAAPHGSYIAAVYSGDGFEAAVGSSSSHAAPGYLGIDIRDIGDDEVIALKLKNSRGAEIIRVDHDAPAGKVGLREHDVILQMNGQIIEGEEQLRRMLRETPAGKKVTLVLCRDGREQTISAQLANRLDVEREAWEQHFTVPEPSQPESADSAPGNQAPGAPPQHASGFLSGAVGSAATKSHNFIDSLISGSSYTGAMVETMGPQLAEFFGLEGTGILVRSVDTNSPASTAGLHAGDIVVRANALAMTSSADWMKVMHENKGKPIAIDVLRDKKELILTLIPDSKRRSSADPAEWLPAGGESRPDVAMVGYSLR
jgi:S1-C subfamily serine protease